MQNNAFSHQMNRPNNVAFKDIPVLITGGARRIGKAMSEGLARAGFPVMIHCNHSVEEAAELARDIQKAGGKAHIIQSDLLNSDDRAQLIQRASEIFGPIRILINNASIFENDTLTNLQNDLWDKHFDLHVKTPSFLAGEFIKFLPKEEDGLIINMIDQRVLKLNPLFFSYTLSKSTLWTATRTMAQALAPQIRVNAISPGPTLPSARQTMDDFNQQVRHTPLQRSPALSEFTDTIIMLWQLKSVTGQMITLDGGQHLAWETADIAGISE